MPIDVRVFYLLKAPLTIKAKRLIPQFINLVEQKHKTEAHKKNDAADTLQHISDGSISPLEN